jgi:hypothetical protein
VLAPVGHGFLFGRVIDDDARVDSAHGLNLVYIYRASSPDKGAVPALLRADLLVPPLITNNLPWSRGYFETIENRPITAFERLRQHCFSRPEGGCVDERSNRIARSEPSTVWGVHSFASIDDLVSEALGVPPSK